MCRGLENRSPLTRVEGSTPSPSAKIKGYPLNSLDQTIPEIQKAYAGVTSLAVFEDLLAQEKKGKRRKVLKRWLRERIKSLKGPQPYVSAVHTITVKPTKDKITRIPIIG